MRGIRIGSAFGIPVRLNWTFLVVLPLFAAFIAWDVAQLAAVINGTLDAGLNADRLTDGLLPWVLGLACALGLFVGVLLHEFGHALVAMRYGYDIESITLWLLGGVANFEEFPENWRHELWISLAGPAVSVLVGVAAYAAFVVTPAGFETVRFVAGYLAILNVVLAAFNLLPGFPMDGGRVLRALLARNRTHARATKQAAEVGKLFAFVLGIVGLFANWFLILLALFIYVAASGEAQQTAIRASFEGVTVDDVMTAREDLRTIEADASVADLLDRIFNERHVGYPVVSGGELVGMVTLGDAAEIDEVERDAILVSDVMTDDVESITPDADASTALERIQQADVGRLPVVDEAGSLVGIISRTDLVRALEIIKASGSPERLERARPGMDFR
jgi:Zn-dependent protease/CBS domain-containing protein